MKRSRGLRALFEEAWRRQRRRRRRVVLSALTALVAMAGIVLVRATRPSRRPVGSSPARFSGLSSIALPLSGRYASLTRVGGRLIIAGGPGGYPLNVSGASTSLVRGRAAGRCTTATLAPNSLRLDDVRRANCGDPALYRLSVMPVISVLQIAERPAMEEVRIAVTDPTARDGYRLGPVVMRYDECSDCNAQWIIGDHSLWINGPYAQPRRSSGAYGGEILRVSLHTGRVVQRLAVPTLSRALLAVNRNGLWLAPSIETGFPAAHLSARLRRAYSSLYLIAPGADRARDVLDVGNGIRWLTASNDGHRVWLEQSSHGTDRMITFTGASADRRREGPLQHNAIGTDDELGEGTTPYSAGSANGVDGVIAPNNSDQAIVFYSTRILTERILVTTPRPDAYEEQPDAETLGGFFYFLDPSISFARDTVAGRLYRLPAR